jgi:thymidine phosphorylase
VNSEATLVPSDIRRSDGSTLRARRLGIHTQDEAVVFMRVDCHVCRSEGLRPHSKVLLSAGTRQITATLYQISSRLLDVDEAGLSEAAWERLQLTDGDLIRASHPEPVESLAAVRGKIYGQSLQEPMLRSIVTDVVRGNYSDIDLSAFITACAARPLDEAETIALTRVMVDVGDRLSWNRSPIFDKHSVGGLPGNRTTPIIVAIVAAHGLAMPKTSSRAITSPAGTADTMETMAPVDLDILHIRRVVEKEGGCIVWGGAVRLSPADDILIRVERALDIDSEGQLVASILSKKIAAGASHVILDLPVGPTAKLRTTEAAEALSRRLTAVARTLGLQVTPVLTDGSQPVGRGIGPALEAHDVMAVLQRSLGYPEDLKTKSCQFAGTLLEHAGVAPQGRGASMAASTIEDGRAWTKFQRICDAQGGMRQPPTGAKRQPLLAAFTGKVAGFDNRKLAKLAKLAGAPDAKAAGVELHVRANQVVERGEPLCTIHAESIGELQYALEYALANSAIVSVQPQ